MPDAVPQFDVSTMTPMERAMFTAFQSAMVGSATTGTTTFGLGAGGQKYQEQSVITGYGLDPVTGKVNKKDKKTSTFGDVFSQFWKYDDKQTRAIQHNLYQAGLLEGGRFVLGDATDRPTTDAYQRVMEVAYMKGISIDEAMEYVKKHPQPGAGKGGGAGGGRGGKVDMHAQAVQAYLSELTGTYMKTWGVPPPPGYVEKIGHSGMNVMEFDAHERAKPAWEHSPQYQTERLSLESQIAHLMGTNEA